jgi:uncharacterized protein (DUF2147 family)
MQRLGYLVVLMALSSSAQAGDTLSFVIGGHRVNIDAPRNCRFASCVSLSIAGIYQTQRKRDRDDDTGVAPAPAPAPAAAPTQAAPVVTSVKPAATPVCAPPAPRPQSPLSPTLVATTTQPVPAPPLRPEPVKTASTETPPDEKTPVVNPPIEKPLVEKAPIETPPVGAPPVAAKPATDAAPVVAKISQRIESELDSPLGDWQTEGKTGTVRIEQCGKALCGYVLNLASNVQENVQEDVQEDVRENVQENGQENVQPSVKGDAVLINMKPKTDLKSAAVWSGNIYSRASGNTYYATMTRKGTNTLRVEACALGRFFCSGNDWTRIATPPQKLITSRQVTTEPRS